MAKVLVTGGSGFIAAHILEQLLERGHEVVTTVRSEEKAAALRAAHPAPARLTVAVVPDMTAAGAFDDVVATPGLTAVLHTASPFHYHWADAKTEVLDPAIEGTTAVLRAVARRAPGVRRVVVTSSFAAILSPAGLQDPKKVFSEADWNPSTYADGLGADKPTTYRVSKTLAERAAWDFVAGGEGQQQPPPAFDLATICPPLVFGPVVHHLRSLAAINTSNERLADLMRGGWKTAIPPSGVFLWVDVRDVARAHVEALERPDAGGKRFFVTAGHFNNRLVVDAVRRGLPDLADRLPGPDVEGGGFPEHGLYGFDNSRATDVLGLQWTSLEKSVCDTIKSLQSVEA